MPSGERALHSRTASTLADLDPKFIAGYWKFVERCLLDVFGKSDAEARRAVARMQDRTEGLSEPAALLVYHDSPVQTASILAGASRRELTEEELLAYDKLLNNPNRTDRASREQILRVHRDVHRTMPKAR